jgi:hypothetical protein
VPAVIFIISPLLEVVDIAPRLGRFPEETLLGGEVGGGTDITAGLESFTEETLLGEGAGGGGEVTLDLGSVVGKS